MNKLIIALLIGLVIGLSGTGIHAEFIVETADDTVMSKEEVSILERTDVVTTTERRVSLNALQEKVDVLADQISELVNQKEALQMLMDDITPLAESVKLMAKESKEEPIP